MTDREMKRYFMTITEAVSLVLQASILGNGGKEGAMRVDAIKKLLLSLDLFLYEDI